MSQQRALVLLLSVWPLLFTTQSARAEKDMLAGHWHLDFYGKCVVKPGNGQACRYLLGPASFAAMNVRGAIISVRGIGDYVSDRSGHFSVHFRTWIAERVPHYGAPARCDDATVFLGLYTGTCRETGSGRGHIATGITGMPDFWEDDTAGFWDGPAHTPFASTGATDTFNPACAGRYDTKRFLGLFGVRPVPSGITARVVLIHTS
jgi:hypothetical protein